MVEVNVRSGQEYDKYNTSYSSDVAKKSPSAENTRYSKICITPTMEVYFVKLQLNKMNNAHYSDFQDIFTYKDILASKWIKLNLLF